MTSRPPAGSGLLRFAGECGRPGEEACGGSEKALKKTKKFGCFHEKGIAK